MHFEEDAVSQQNSDLRCEIKKETQKGKVKQTTLGRGKQHVGKGKYKLSGRGSITILQ